MARLLCVSSPYHVAWRPGWTRVAGRCRAISRAVSRILSGSMPVSGHAHSGVKGWISAAKASKPKPWAATYYLS